jgi:signal transduction histidine kinase/ActR/RegA family two-component response regulator
MIGNQALPVPPAPLTLEQEFLNLTGNNIRRNPLPVLLALALIAVAALGQIATVWVVSWWLLASAGIFGRAIFLRHILREQKYSEASRLRVIYVGNFVNGFILCLSFAFFPFISVTDAALQTVVVAVLCTGVTVGNAGLAKATTPYIATALIATALMWALFPHDDGDGASKAYLLSGLSILMLLAMLGVAKDIYQLFRNSVAMRQKYADLNSQLTVALQDSQAANAAKTRFLAAASHDLRQPVHTLSLLTAALMSRNTKVSHQDKTITEITQTMDNSLQSLARQLDSLLDISKLDAGIITPECSDVDIAPILRRLEQEFSPVAAEKRLQVKADIPTEVSVFTDPTLLERLLRNILANAIKYTERGEISLSVMIGANDFSVHIKDTGIGIAKDQQKLVFEEFYQIDNPHRDRSKGLGLGLSIVQRLCKMLEIKLQLVSESGIGTEFILTLKSSQESKKMEPAVQTESSFKQRLVLVIDDEADIRLATRAYLEALECEVLLAEGTEAALKLIKNKAPDLVIADLRLRDHDNGIDALKAIRQLYPNLPAILVTGDTAPERLRDASKAKAKLLHKPIYSDQLQLAMQELLKEKIV